MSNATIRNLFGVALKNSIVGVYRTKHDNAPLNPTEQSNETFLDAHLIPSPTYSDSLGGDIITYTGIYQIKISVGAGKATAESDKIASDLFKLFKVNTVFADPSGLKVQVVQPLTVGEGRAIDGRWVVPCHIEYRCDTN